MLSQTIELERATLRRARTAANANPNLRIAGTMLASAADLLATLEQVEQPTGALDFVAEAERLAMEMTAFAIMIARATLSDLAS